ncbi:phage terminase small subunit P27 family [Paraeggerthella sp.]|uniref:phage terminase small subunit P27 family n=1 Tax=Paraeggerthella sp. TaxID=2897350 RepID=UPI003AB38ACB
MARRAVVSGASKGHQTKAQKDRRAQVEAEWRRGNIADYEPMMLSESGMIVFAELANAMPNDALAKVDGYTLETAADALDKMRECREAISSEGLIVDMPNARGELVPEQNKSILVYQKYSEIAKKWLIELGLTPSARSKIANDAAAKATKKSSVFDVMDDEDEG